jgi:PleD family two-component response regulator
MAQYSKHQILVVDDDPSVRETIATLLMSAGYDVLVAEDGFGALLQLRKLLPDVIIPISTCRECPALSSSQSFVVAFRRF